MKTSNKQREKRAGKPGRWQIVKNQHANPEGAYATDHTEKKGKNVDAFVVPWQLYDSDPYEGRDDRKTL